MRAYGYERDSEAESPCELSEATLLCTIEELDRIIRFLETVRDTCQQCDSVKGFHQHFRDFDPQWDSKQADFIICMTDE